MTKPQDRKLVKYGYRERLLNSSTRETVQLLTVLELTRSASFGSQEDLQFHRGLTPCRRWRAYWKPTILS